MPGDRGPGSLNLGGQLTLEQMNLDRKADFEGDAFDPFNIGNKGNVDLQLKAQNAYLDKANSKGGQIWTPEQMQLRSNAAANGMDPNSAAAAAQSQVVSNLDDLDDLEEIADADESMPTGQHYEVRSSQVAGSTNVNGGPMNALASNQNKKMMAKGAHGHTDDFDAPDLAQPDNSSGAAQYDDDGIPIIGNGPS